MRLVGDVAVVIPCLNEARTIGRLVREVRSVVPSIYVVDDGSTDNTAGEAKAAGAQLLRHSEARGKGAALQTGFSASLRDGFCWALSMDGDGQHEVSDIARFLEAAVYSNAAMIVGDRMQASERMPLVRRFVNRWMSQQLSTFCGERLPDSQCGFRLLKLSAWNRVDFTAEHFEIESELLVRFLKAGMKVEFVPVLTRYGGEQSKIRPLRDTLRWFRWWREIRKEYATAPYATAPQDATV